MTYDPNWPQNGEFVDGNRFREQFGGLHDLIPGSGGISGAHIDSVTTLDPTQQAAASVSMNGTALHFTFSIPRGHDGNVGPQGQQGDTGPIGFTGPEGIQGPMGEVSQAALDAAIASVLAGSSGNSNGVALLNLFVSDPPSQSDMQAVANKLDELINALRRP